MAGGHNHLDLITLNVDVINMSDAHPSLFRSCLYKQTATYYFIEALVHEIVFKISKYKAKSLEHKNKVKMTLTLLH